MAIQNGHQNNSRTMTTNDQARRPVPPPQKKSRGWIWIVGIILVILIVAALAGVFWHKMQAQKQLEANTQKMAQPTVLVVHPEKGDASIRITLPGTVNGLIESSVYAQVSGYIKAWHVDIGGQVKAGQLLAEIDTPVTDQSLLQAGESVKQAQANLALAKVTADRYNALFSTHAVSQEDVDTQNSNEKVQEANVSAAQAFESGIQKTEAFKEVRAPFDGVVTARRIDVGDFVSATGQTATASVSGSAPTQTGTPNQALFSVAQIKTLRIYVNVPEQYAPEIVPGIEAKLDLASSPNGEVTGKVVRTADAIDPTSLTLLTEVDVDNANGKLLPGGYAQVHFDIINPHPPLVIPGNSMLFRQQGPQVGVVDDSQTVHLKTIKIARDLGTKLEIADGINADDSIIVNPSDSLTDGQKVNVDTQNNSQKPQVP
jgi:membrane fusion protein, multidrug efflux system